MSTYDDLQQDEKFTPPTVDTWTFPPEEAPEPERAYRELVDVVAKRRAKFVDLAVEVCEGLNVVLRHLNDALREFGDHVQGHGDESGEGLDGGVGGSDAVGVHEELLSLPGNVADLVEDFSHRVEQFLTVHHFAPSSVGPDGSVEVPPVAVEEAAAGGAAPHFPPGGMPFWPGGLTAAGGSLPTEPEATGSHPTGGVQ